MNFCTKCGQKLEEGEKSCTNCGEIVGQATEEIGLGEVMTSTHGDGQDINNKGKTKKIKLQLAMIISVIILCLVFIGAGFVNYTKAAEVKKDIELGNKYVEDGEYEEAILAFKDVIKVEPKNIEARVGLARAYIKTGRSDEAEKVLKEAVSINSKKVDPYLELAKLYIADKDPFNAIKVLTEGYKASKGDSIKALLDELKSGITADNIDKTITLGENYSLPKEITIKMNNIEVLFPVKWDISSVDSTKVGIAVFTGTLESLDKEIKLTVNVIGIASIEDINSTIDVNGTYSLPSKLKAKMTDGSAREVEVAWNPSAVDTSKVGNISCEGTVSGYGNKVKLTLSVIGIATIEDLSSTINQNDKYTLPAKVKAKMTDGSTREVDISWNPSSVNTGKAGSYTYQGTVKEYGGKVKLTLNIKAKQNDDDYTPEMAIRLAKQHDGIDLDNPDVGASVSDPIYENGKKYYYVRLYSKSMRAEGGTGTIDFMTIAKDGSTID